MGDRASSLGKRALAHPNRGVRRRHALTLKLDHPSGAGHTTLQSWSRHLSMKFMSTNITRIIITSRPSAGG